MSLQDGGGCRARTGWVGQAQYKSDCTLAQIELHVPHLVAKTEKRATKSDKLKVLFSESVAAKQNQKIPFHFLSAPPPAEKNKKGKKIFGFGLRPARARCALFALPQNPSVRCGSKPLRALRVRRSVASRLKKGSRKGYNFTANFTAKILIFVKKVRILFKRYCFLTEQSDTKKSSPLLIGEFLCI